MQAIAIIICIICSYVVSSLYLQLQTQLTIVQNYNLHWQNLQK